MDSAPRDTEVTIALIGNTMLGRGVAMEGCRRGTGEGLVWSSPGWPRAPLAAVETLAGPAVDCATPANNHALDYGPIALWGPGLQNDLGLLWTAAVSRDRLRRVVAPAPR